MKYSSYPQNKIDNISLITTCGCNLNCNYCMAAKSLNSHSKELAQATEQALIDGTFLENTKQVFKKLEINPIDIKDLNFWGQEPTLTLHHITDHLAEWIDFMPNVDNLFFSTNGMAYTDRIIDFIKACVDLFDRPCTVGLQYSYDGNYSTDKVRKASTDVILNNLTTLVTELNKINLKNIKIEIMDHGVISDELIKSFKTQDDMINYITQAHNLWHQLSLMNTNRNVFIRNSINFSSEVPINTSSEDGRLWNYFVNTCKEIKYKYNQCEEIDMASEGLLYLPRFVKARLLEETNCKSLKELVNLVSEASEEELEKLNQRLSTMIFCGNMRGGLKIMYDGTLVNCQSLIFDTIPENIKDTNDNIYYIKKFIANHKGYINPLKDSEENIRDNIYLYEIMNQESYFYIYQQVAILLYNLALAHQVSAKYLKYENILQASFILTQTHSCFFNGLLTTGSYFNRDTGLIRRYCNGILDEVLEDIE